MIRAIVISTALLAVAGADATEPPTPSEYRWTPDPFFPMTQEVLRADPTERQRYKGYRVAPGVGLRIVVPPMGPTPIAGDAFNLRLKEEPPVYFDAPPLHGHVTLRR